MEIIKEIATYCGYISSIMVILVAVFKPIREWFFGVNEIREGQRCLLRSEMLKIYYEHCEQKKLRQHSRECFDRLYASYKALKGNSFIDDIYAEIREWEVVS